MELEFRGSLQEFFWYKPGTNEHALSLYFDPHSCRYRLEDHMVDSVEDFSSFDELSKTYPDLARNCMEEAICLLKITAIAPAQTTNPVQEELF
jgi:hypothetical protein